MFLTFKNNQTVLRIDTKHKIYSIDTSATLLNIPVSDFDFKNILKDIEQEKYKKVKNVHKEACKIERF